MEKKFEKLNEVIKYIEEHLDGDISIEDLAKIADCSAFDFQRLFSFLCDISPTTYIRRRRMSYAVDDLKKGYKVIDVALKFGYTNPVSFTRSFKELYGVLPSEIINSFNNFNIFPKLELLISKKEDYKMKFRIIKIDKVCSFLGIEKTIADSKFNLIPKFWDKTRKEGSYNSLETKKKDLYML